MKESQTSPKSMILCIAALMASALLLVAALFTRHRSKQERFVKSNL